MGAICGKCFICKSMANYEHLANLCTPSFLARLTNPLNTVSPNSCLELADKKTYLEVSDS